MGGGGHIPGAIDMSPLRGYLALSAFRGVGILLLNYFTASLFHGLTSTVTLKCRISSHNHMR